MKTHTRMSNRIDAKMLRKKNCIGRMSSCVQIKLGYPPHAVKHAIRHYLYKVGCVFVHCTVKKKYSEHQQYML